MVILPHAADDEGVMPRGTWRRWRNAIIVCCPLCGLQTLLDHEVDASGAVTPSVACPSRGCGWHQHVRLKAWRPK